MTSPQIVVRYDLTVVHERGGEWCPTYLLPSGIEGLIALSTRADPTTIVGHMTFRTCVDCGLPLNDVRSGP